MPSTLSLLKTLLLASSVAALPRKRDGGNTLQLDVIQVNKAAVQGTVNAPFSQSRTLFFVQLGLGSPQQQLYSILDTGSSNLVVFPRARASGTCGFTTDICNHLFYESTQSNTFVNLAVPYTASYGDGSGGSGTQATDNLIFEGTSIPAFEFIDLTTSNTLGQSVFGTGYATNEGTTIAYPNLPQRLVTAGAINSPVFSLWLNSLRSAAPGSMLYGGIDSQKYCGNLVTLPIVPENGIYREFNIQLQGITAKSTAGNPVTIPLGGTTVSLLDSGTNSVNVPAAAYNALLENYGATPATGNGFPQVACTLATSTQTVDFTFAGLVIPVPLSQLVGTGGTGQTRCDFFVSLRAAGSTPPIILGSSFLSSAYVVYDLGNNNIHMGRAVFDAAASNVVAVGTGPNAVPSVAGPVCPVTTSTTSTTSTATTSSSTTSSSLTTTTSSSLTTTTSSATTTTTTGSTSTPSTSTSTTTTVSTSTPSTSTSTTSTVSTSTPSTSTSTTATTGTSTTTTVTTTTSTGSVSGTATSTTSTWTSGTYTSTPTTSYTWTTETWTSTATAPTWTATYSTWANWPAPPTCRKINSW